MSGNASLDGGHACLMSEHGCMPSGKQNFNPSIDFLELYALSAGVVTWVPHLTNHTMLFHSDNTPTVHALIKKSSDSHQMMILP